MNPFTAPGVDFLWFYLALAAVLAGIEIVARWASGPAGLTRHRPTDPYGIALMRAGDLEAIRVASMSLIDQGLIKQTGASLLARAGATSSDDLEASILRQCTPSSYAHRLIEQRHVTSALARRRQELQGLGLVPDEQLAWRLRAMRVAMTAILLFLAIGKFFYAYQTGHRNVGFLIMVVIVTLMVAIGVPSSPPSCTPRGRGLLRHMQRLFRPLWTRKGTRTPEERRFLVAVFGAIAIAGLKRTLWPAFKPPRPVGSSGCGTSSSCGSGGGCGGGGCGGCGS